MAALRLQRALAPTGARTARRCMVAPSCARPEEVDAEATAVTRATSDPALWIFGYGSLMWRPGFVFEARRAAWIEGFARRFWQGSTDHRGVPGAPGRVVTLHPTPGARCHGVAYRVARAARARVLAALDQRERGGYRRERVALHLPATRPGARTRIESGLVYRALPDNPNYLGPGDLDEIAQVVAQAQGPSGSNHEYLKRLAATLRSMGFDEPALFELEARVEALTGAAGVLPHPAPTF